MEERRYKPEDLDANGNPYADAVPIGETRMKESTGFSTAHWPVVPSVGQEIYVISKYQKEWIKTKVFSIMTSAERISFAAPINIQGSLGLVTRDYLSFDKNNWNNGWRFSDKP